MASFSSYANGVKRWYQKLELPMPPERIFGAHMMLIGGLACLIGTYFFASMTMWNDGYVNLTLRPRLISLGIYDPYDTEQIQRVWLPLIGEFSTSKLPFFGQYPLTMTDFRLFGWGCFHIGLGLWLVYAGAAHYYGARGGATIGEIFWLLPYVPGLKGLCQIKWFTPDGPWYKVGLPWGSFANTPWPILRRTYADALSPHTIYIGLLFFIWGFVLWFVLDKPPVPLQPAQVMTPNGLMPLEQAPFPYGWFDPYLNQVMHPMNTINGETTMCFVWGVLFVALGAYWWYRPPRSINITHLEDTKAVFHVHLTAIGYVSFALAIVGFLALRNHPSYLMLNDMNVIIYGKKIVNPGRMIHNMITFNHVQVGLLYVAAGVFHGGQYLHGLNISGAYKQARSKFITWFQNPDLQTKIVGTTMFVSFVTVVFGYGMICWNTGAELDLNFGIYQFRSFRAIQMDGEAGNIGYRVFRPKNPWDPTAGGDWVKNPDGTAKLVKARNLQVGDRILNEELGIGSSPTYSFTTIEEINYKPEWGQPKLYAVQWGSWTHFLRKVNPLFWVDKGIWYLQNQKTFEATRKADEAYLAAHLKAVSLLNQIDDAQTEEAKNKAQAELDKFRPELEKAHANMLEWNERLASTPAVLYSNLRDQHRDGEINDAIFFWLMIGGWLFGFIPLLRIAFHNYQSPWYRDFEWRKQSPDFPCIGPVKGGTCGVSIQDQLWFCILFSIKPLSAIAWYLDGGWIATMMARGNEAYYLTHNISHTGGVFLYMWNETTWIWTDNHLTAMLLLGHLIWFVSFALWFKDRGSRAEGGDIQSRWVRLMGKRLGIKTLQEVRFPVSNLATAKLWGTVFFYTGTFVLVFLYFADGFFQNR